MWRFFLVIFLATCRVHAQDSLDSFLVDFGKYAEKNDEAILDTINDLRQMESAAVLASMEPIERMLYRRNCAQLNSLVRELSSVTCRHSVICRLVSLSDARNKSEALTILQMCIDIDLRSTRSVSSSVSSDALVNSIESTKKEAQSIRDKARLHRDKMIEFRARLSELLKASG